MMKTFRTNSHLVTAVFLRRILSLLKKSLKLYTQHYTRRQNTRFVFSFSANEYFTIGSYTYISNLTTIYFYLGMMDHSHDRIHRQIPLKMITTTLTRLLINDILSSLLFNFPLAWRGFMHFIFSQPYHASASFTSWSGFSLKFSSKRNQSNIRSGSRKF
jgi:hypothetical protein